MTRTVTTPDWVSRRSPCAPWVRRWWWPVPPVRWSSFRWRERSGPRNWQELPPTSSATATASCGRATRLWPPGRGRWSTPQGSTPPQLCSCILPQPAQLWHSTLSGSCKLTLSHHSVHFGGEGEVKYPPGFHPTSVMQLYPPAACTALAFHSEWQL